MAVFLKPLFDNFGAKIGQNRSVQNGCLGPGSPTNCKKSGLVASLVLLAASGCFPTRFSSISGQIWDGFSMFFSKEFGMFFSIKSF